MSTPASDELVIATYTCSGVVFIICVIAFAQLCVSPLVGSELKGFKYRMVNCIISLSMIAEVLCSILHYQNTTNPTYVITYIMTRAFTLCLLAAGGIMFLLTTFDTLYQSTLTKERAPLLFRIIIKTLFYIFPAVIAFCVLFAFNQDEIFWVQLLGIFVVIFPATLSIVAMVGLIIVITRMNAIRHSMEKSLKDTDANDPDVEALKEDMKSSDPQKHGRSRAIGLRKKSKQLTIVSIMLSVYWIAIIVLIIRRITELETPEQAGTVYQQIFDLRGYLGSMIAQFILIAILIGWPWRRIECKQHRENFTMCYLCCMGEPDPELQKKKSITNVFSNLADNKVKTPGTPVPINLKANAAGKVSAFLDGDDENENDEFATLVPMTSTPVKICIFNIEVLFFSVDLFVEITQSNSSLNDMDKSKIIEEYLGGSDYYQTIVERLDKWSSQQCVLFIAHSWLTVSQLKQLLLKLDLLKFFVSDTMDKILTRKSKQESEMKVNWNERVIGRRSDYIELLKNEESDYFHNINSNKSEKRNKEQQLLKSMHLLILQFIKIWNVEHEEILYIDYNESITNYMKQINVCKILKVNSHQVGKMKLQEMAMKDKVGGITDATKKDDPYQLMPSLSIHLGEVIATGEHPIMTTRVMALIDNIIS